ncbi:MAG TPA: bifunctional metallophosphatase/5'-nucleotidase [Chitinophagaceae bacterium]|nr:bifunctional metallophosphatase/5'-nucleotidase [Chitinophagaceae bacterium]
MHEKDSLHVNCSCDSCLQLNEAEKKLHIQISQNSRREFFKTAGKLGLGMGIGGGLISPLAASTLHTGESDYKARSLEKSKVLQNGKAQLLTLLHTADIHSQLNIHDEFFIENGKPVYKKRGGFATLKTMVNELRKKNPLNTLVIDGGDCFQGSGIAALTEGKAIIPLMNNIGYDIMLPGNWEVVYGKETMMKDMFAYDGVKVCANMFHDTKDELDDELIFPPYFIKHIAGIKIGFIGYNDPLTPKRQSPAYSDGIRFTPPEKNVMKYIRLLREYEKCEMVFLLTHMGLAQQVGLANMAEVKGVDYILGADTHERIRKPIEGKYTKVTEPGAFGSFISKLDIVIEDGKIKEQNYQLLDVDPSRYKEDEEMKMLVKKTKEPFEKELNKVVGKTSTPLVRYYVIETPMDNLITDALMWKFNPDIALSNGFRFCPPLVPDPKTGMADITKDFLWSMLPVDSEAKMGTATGRQLWDWMEKELENAFAKDPANRFGGWVIRFKGMQVNFTINKEMGKRVNWIKIDSSPIDHKREYKFVACEREGDPDTTLCRVDGVKAPTRSGFTLHNVIEEYLKKFSPIAPKIEGRCTATDAPGNLLTQLSGVGYEFK